MPSLLDRTFRRVAALRPSLDRAERHSLAEKFLGIDNVPIVSPPNGRFWFQTMPLRDGTRIRGASGDPNREQRLWASCFGADRDCLAGKRVLDVGANDGFFSIAAALCGADEVHAVNPATLAHGTFPANLRFAADEWDANIRVTVDEFQNLPGRAEYDVILLYGVLNHLENPVAGMRAVERLLAPGGRVYLETQVSPHGGSQPLFELASDVYATTVPQHRDMINSPGNSTIFVPNELGVRALGVTFGLTVDGLTGGNAYEAAFGGPARRRVFVLSRASDRPLTPKG